MVDHKVKKAFLSGLLEFSRDKHVERACVITKNLGDFVLLAGTGEVSVLRVPAALARYWLGQSELDWEG